MRPSTDKNTRPQDWTEDFGHENGRYQCRCIECAQMFYGHKRRVLCKVCRREVVMTQASGKKP
jgi:Zn finger protein HypA/HybF involved in hydrogenase expression